MCQNMRSMSGHASDTKCERSYGIEMMTAFRLVDQSSGISWHVGPGKYNEEFEWWPLSSSRGRGDAQLVGGGR